MAKKNKNKKNHNYEAAQPNIFKDVAAASKNNATAVVVAAIAAFVPLIVYLRVVPVNPEIAKFWTADINYDFFSFYKVIWFLFLTLIAIIIFCIGVKNGKIVFTRTWIYVPAGVYALTAVLSTVFAKHTAVALYGFPDRYEGLFVILGYILVFVVVLNIAQAKGALKLILAGLFFSAFVASLIGIFQFIGRIELFGEVYGPLDFFKTSAGRMLITPQEYRDTLNLNFQFPARTICTTLYNTNYVGSFMEMTLMLSVVLFIFETDKTGKVIFYILSMFIFSNWIGCLSRAGYLGALAAILILIAIAVLRFALFKKETDRDFIRLLSKNIAVIVGSFIVLFFVLDFTSENTISRQFSRLDVKTAEKMATSGPAALLDDIKDVKITSDTIFYSTANTAMQIKMASTNLLFYTGEGIPLIPTFSDDKESYVFTDPKYSNYKIRVDKNNIIFLSYGDALIHVSITNQGFKYFDERGGFTDMIKAPSWGFEGRERVASNRGYIWSRTLPLLKDVVFLGNGPDAFALHFPQHDYIAKLKYYANPYVIIDKPHNMYLQTAMNTGIISLICVLIIFISYVAASIKIILTNNRRTVYSTVSLGAFLGVTAYLVTAVFNDSLISAAPVFWIMLGMGHAVNFVVIRTQEQPLRA
ncbi:MAG: O-antigen ligase family protein [Victivallales bacterium]